VAPASVGVALARQLTPAARSHHALHLHEARALDEHGRRGGASSRVHAATSASMRRSGAPRAEGRARARSARRARSRRCRAAARTRRPRRASRPARPPQFAHVAEHEHRAPGSREHRRWRPGHRIRIGVVGVVDQRRAGGPRSAAAPLGPCEGGEPAPRSIASGTPSANARPRRERVAHVVHARHRSARARLAGGVRGSISLCERAARSAAHRAGALEPKSTTRAPAFSARHSGGERVVGVDHRDAVGAQALVDLALGSRDRLDANRECRCARAAGVVDQRHVGRASPVR
jgi:hypothetical protein